MRPGGLGWRCARRGAGAADLARGSGVVNAEARPEGIEPPTCGFEGRRSVQLSYGRLREAARAAKGNGVSKGARTLNPRIHSPVLYRLSYAHREGCAAVRGPLRAAGAPAREGAPGGSRTPDPRLRRPLLCPAELRAQGGLPLPCSGDLAVPGHPIHMSKSRGGGIRTRDLLRPRQARYQAALRPGIPGGPAAPAPNREGVSSAPTGICQRVAATCTSLGTSRRIASPRWEIASFSAGGSSAIVRPGTASGRKSGS